MSSELIDPDFMPFTREQLAARFAFTERHGADPVARFVESAARYRAYLAAPAAVADPRAVRRARQIEKDETFWTAASLMSFFEHTERVAMFGQLLDRAVASGPGSVGFGSWEGAMRGRLELYFEVGLSSPRAYRQWLVEHVAERNLVAYVIDAARERTNLEGRTHLDAMLLAPDTGFAAHFEAKVTSDIDTKVSYDLMRNQIARNVDGMLESPGPRVGEPLSSRQAERSVFVLLTPRMFQERPASRLFGWLMNEYRRNPQALARDLTHRDEDWTSVSARLGWATWEDCQELVPGSCRWLDALSSDNPA